MSALPVVAATTDWLDAPRLWGHSLHALCSYLGSTPPSLAHALIQRLTRPGDVVIDPFSGRGTIPLEACLGRRVGVGSDLSPLAFVLTGAKVDVPPWAAIASRFFELRNAWSAAGSEERTRGAADVPPQVAAAFGPRTIEQLAWLREALGLDDRIDAFLLSALAGSLHGRGRGFITDASPNAYSRSPGAIVADRATGDIPPEQDIFRVVARRLERVLADGAPPVSGIALLGDARTIGHRCAVALESRRLPQAQLALTSPPFLGVLRYGAYNWLRMWLIGALGSSVDAEVDGLRPRPFSDLLRLTLDDLRQAMAPDAVVALSLADVERVRGHPIRATPLPELVWEACAEPIGYRLVGVIAEQVSPRRRVTKMWGALAGQATRADAILVLAMSERGRARAVAALDRPIPWPARASIQRRARLTGRLV